ncbi:MAG: thioredoxin [Candidatus Pacearchaeota archaeon]
MSVTVLDSKSFNEFTSKGTSVVDFYADWCGPCKIMAPAFERASGKLKDVKFAKINVEGNQDVAMKYGVLSIPTTIVFKNGSVRDMHTGALSEPEILKLAEKYK